MPTQAIDIARQCSPFLEQSIQRHPDWFSALAEQGRLENPHPPATPRLQELIGQEGLDPALRIFRNQEMMRIIWRDLNRRGSLRETFDDLSRLAELCLQAAIDHHGETLRARHGAPSDSGGSRQRLVVIGMGKLGGRELNLSSDIDLVFCYPHSGSCDGARSLSNEQFFTRLTRSVIKSLAEVTEHGFCFRVDTRLRPFGESGPLVCSFGAMEQYYQREGRDWERYALVKARPVGGDLAAGAALLRALKPFVYRRYIDYGAVEALQDMQQAVRRDAAERGREQDIKRGPGGIREIEFMIQAHQLLRGGREPGLQTQSIFEALETLVELSVMEPGAARRLREHYVFLRRLENAIQALHDQQTHVLPSGEDLQRVARAMRLKDAEDLRQALGKVRRQVDELFRNHLRTPGHKPPDDTWTDRWRALRDSGDERSETGPELRHFLERLGRQSLSQRAAQRLDRFMPLLLERLERSDLAPEALTDVLELVLAITRRSAYLALLVQNPAALDRMLGLFDRSDWVARVVIRHPALLDELIDPTLGRILPSRGEISATTRRVLRSHQGPEDALQALNHIKLATSLRIAVAELEMKLSAREAQEALTALAEALLDACLELAANDIQARYPGLTPGGLCVIGYGSLGARELAYMSDLDLIFLYEASQGTNGEKATPPLERFYTQMVRRLLSWLTLPTPSGKLYETDTRLRPNGRSGLLVSSVSAFEKYQHEKAWTWELQALTRARALGGNPRVAAGFGRIRRSVLSRPHPPEQLREQIVAMRRRLRSEFGDKDPLKHGPGGLVDIDFIAQLGVLQCAARHAEVLDSTGTPGQLRALAAAGWLSREQSEALIEAHETFARARHLSTIARDQGGYAPDLVASRRHCEAILGADAEAWFSCGSPAPGSMTDAPDTDHSG